MLGRSISSVWFILPTCSSEGCQIAWVWIPALLLTSCVTQPFYASVSSSVKWLHKCHEDKWVHRSKAPRAVAGHGTVLYKLATYSTSLQQPWDYSNEPVARKSLQSGFAYTHMAMSWWNLPCGRTDPAAMFRFIQAWGRGERGEWCDATLSSDWTWTTPETCPMWISQGRGAADHSVAGCESSLLREPLTNLEPMCLLYRLGNRIGFLQPCNSHFYL